MGYHHWNFSEEKQANRERAICFDCGKKRYKKMMIIKNHYYSPRNRDNNEYICDQKLVSCLGRRMS